MKGPSFHEHLHSIHEQKEKGSTPPILTSPTTTSDFNLVVKEGDSEKETNKQQQTGFSPAIITAGREPSFILHSSSTTGDITKVTPSKQVQEPLPSTGLEGETPHCQVKTLMLFQRVSQFLQKLWKFIRGISRGTWLRLGVLALIVASLFIALGLLQQFGLIEKLFNWIDSTGYWGLLLIVGIFQLTALPVSSLYSLICISSGFLYGIWIGSAACMAGAALAATSGFFASRYLCRGWVQKKVEKRPLFQNIDDIIAKEGFKLLFFIRFVPIPFGWTNSFMAATKMKYYVYIVASILGLAPEMVALVYVGTTIKTLSDAFSEGGGFSPTQIGVLVVQIVAALLCLIICTLIGRKALNKIRAMKKTPELPISDPVGEPEVEEIYIDGATDDAATTTTGTTDTITPSAEDSSVPLEVVINTDRWTFVADSSSSSSSGSFSKESL